MEMKKVNSNWGEVGGPQTFNSSPALARSGRKQCLDGREDGNHSWRQAKNWGPGDCLAFGTQNMIICVTHVCLGNVAACTSFPSHLSSISLPQYHFLLNTCVKHVISFNLSPKVT